MPFKYSLTAKAEIFNDEINATSEHDYQASEKWDNK